MSLKIVSGKFKGHKITAPSNIRPATSNLRDALFNISQNQIENANFLDLFAGSGAMGLEALSRGARFSTFIDKSPLSIRYINENIRKLKVEEFTKVICQDIIKALKRTDTFFDIISIDPPFIIYKNNPTYIDEIFLTLETKKLLDQNTLIFLEKPTYSKRDEKISNFILKKKRKYGSAYLLEYSSKKFVTSKK